MTTNNSSAVVNLSKPQQYAANSRLTSGYLVSLVLGSCSTIISAVLHNPVLVKLLIVTFIATSFEQQIFKLVAYVKKSIKLWQIVIAVVVAGAFIGLGMYPADAQLFNPLQQQTNTVLNSAGAGQASASITGIFTLMNIVVTIAGVGAVIYGAYNQNQGHSLRESFTPLALVLLVYIGCSFVMRLFLGTAAG